MSSSEQFSWFEPSKKTKKGSSESSYLNAPAAPAAAEQVDMSQKHERDIDLHPRVLPAPLFEKLVGAEDKTEKAPKKDSLPHIPIPVERIPPEPARAERPVYEKPVEDPPERFMPLESEPQEPVASEYSAERRTLRRGVVAGAITRYSLNQLLTQRKQRRFETIAEQQMPLPSAGNTEQHRYQGVSARFEQPLGSPAQPQHHYEHPLYPQPAPAEFAQAPQPVAPGEQVVLQPGQRLERRGWYSVVVDEHGREVQGALNYGEAFHREQRQEQAPPAVAGAPTDDTSAVPADTTYLGAMGAPAVDGMLGSGQVDPSHTLGQGSPHPIDPNHRLPQRQNPIIATLANPVLWLAVAVLIIAYFIAALL